MEGFQRTLIAALGLDHLEGAIDNVLGDGLFALVHHIVHEFGEHEIPVLGIGQNTAFLGATAAGHTL